MPFMKGVAPIRRTLKYLESGKIIFRDRIKIFSINYNTVGVHHQGARDFAFWYLPQIQYKHPEVQVITFKDMTPSPFIRCYFDNGEDILIDIDSKTKEDVHKHVQRVLCKPESHLAAELAVKEKKDNPANFGFGCERHCICEILGQVPCPGVVPLPIAWRGKTKSQKD